ncbi:hypothetical protein LTR95_010828 [Oleoguttula sp. CCFEE 5521]
MASLPKDSQQAVEAHAAPAQSRLLSIAPELRLQIYSHCFEERFYHVTWDTTTVTPLFGAMRQVCKLIKHEIDPLYEEAGRRKVRRIDVILEAHVWWSIYTQLADLHPHRRVDGVMRIGIDSSAGGKHVDDTWAEDSATFHSLHCDNMAAMNIIWRIAISKAAAGDEYKKLIDWFYYLDEIEVCYKIRHKVRSAEYPLDWPHAHEHEGYRQPAACVECSLYFFIDTVNRNGYRDGSYDEDDDEDEEGLCGTAVSMLQAVKSAVEAFMENCSPRAITSSQVEAGVAQSTSSSLTDAVIYTDACKWCRNRTKPRDWRFAASEGRVDMKEVMGWLERLD